MFDHWAVPVVHLLLLNRTLPKCLSVPVVRAKRHRRYVHDGAAEVALLLLRHHLHAAQSREVTAHVLTPSQFLCLVEDSKKLT